MIRNKLKPWTYTDTIDATGALPSNARFGRIWVGHGASMKLPIEITPDEYRKINDSAWHNAGNNEAFFWREPTEVGQGSQQIHVQSGGGQAFIEYIKGRPGLVYWGYVIVNEKPMYDPSQTSHFELHASEQPDIIIKILELAGVSIEDGQLIQYASSEEQQNKGDERI